MDNTGNGSAAIVSWVRRTLKGHPQVMDAGPHGAAGLVDMLPLGPGGRFPAIGLSITTLPIKSVVAADPLWEVGLVDVMAIDVAAKDFANTIELAKVIKNWLRNGTGAASMTVAEGTIQRFTLEGPPIMFKRRDDKLDRLEYYNGYRFRFEVR